MVSKIFEFIPIMTKYTFLLCCLFLFLISIFGCQSQPYKQGEILYNNFCANCHMEDGSGLKGNIPPLAGADYVKENPLATACITRKGMTGELIVNGANYNQPMPAITELSEFEITNVINYINHAWGNDYGVVKLKDVRAELSDCP